MIFCAFFIFFFGSYIALEKLKINQRNETRRSLLNIIYYALAILFSNSLYLNSVVRGYRIFDIFLILGNLDIYVKLPSYEITYNILNILVSFSVNQNFFLILGISDLAISIYNIFLCTKSRYFFRIFIFIVLRIFFVFYYSWVFEFYTPFIWLLAFRSIFHVLSLK